MKKHFADLFAKSSPSDDCPSFVKVCFDRENFLLMTSGTIDLVEKGPDDT